MGLWYVDGEASEGGNGSSGTPWNHFADITWGTGGVVAGDTLYISGGATSVTYTETLTIGASGSVGNIITVTKNPNAGDNGTVIIDGGSARSYCINITGSYVTVSYMKCIHSTENGIRSDNRSNVTVEYNTLDEIYGEAIDFHGCSNSTIRGNIITTFDDDASQTDGIVLYSGCDTITVEKNWVYLTNQGGAHNDCIQGNDGTDFTIRWNYCVNMKDSEGYTDAQGIYITEMAGTDKIYGNIVYLAWGGLAIASRNLVVGTAQTIIINNTTITGALRCIRVSEEADPIIKNNIMYQTRAAAGYICLTIENWAGTETNIDGNLYYSLSSTAPDIINYGSTMTLTEFKALEFETNGVYASPSLGANYAPDSATDPSVGAGIVLDAEYDDGIDISTDISSGENWLSTLAFVDRDTDAEWDIGAYEYEEGEAAATKYVAIKR